MIALVRRFLPRAAAAAAAAALLILAGCGGGLVADLPTEFDALINDGWLKYNQGKYDEAYRLFSKAV